LLIAWTMMPRAVTWEPRERTPERERLYHRLVDAVELDGAPEIAVRLLSMIDGNASTRDIVALIARDPGLTASLLRLANSALFSTRGVIANLQQVVLLLGFMRVRELALAASFWEHLSKLPLDARALRMNLWRHSAATAMASRSLALHVRSVDAEHAYVVGLLHDVGKLVLGLHFGEDYWRLLGVDGPDGDALVADEEARFGCNHATAAGWLLSAWRLAPALVQAIATHHVAAHRDPDLAALLVLGERLALALEGSDQVPPALRSAYTALTAVHLKEEQWRQVAQAVMREREAMDVLFAS
jgi:putative nucleotidyltransferase with HDIG domain